MYTYENVLKNSVIEALAVSFLHDAVTVAGLLYLPQGKMPEGGWPAVVIGHPTGGVKEQTAGVYAVKLAEQGIATLTLDASYQGESGGEPRYLEDPSVRSEDLSCGIDYLTTRADINAEKLGVLGICASGGYAIHAAETDLRMKAIATVSMADLGDMFRNGLARQQDDEQRRAFLGQIAAARTAEANGAEPIYAPFVPRTAEDAAKMPRDYREGYEYYRVSPNAHPRAVSQFRLSRANRLVSFTALDYVELLAPRPLLMIAGTEAQTRYFSEEAYAKYPEGMGKKELTLVKGATHIEMYYVEDYVDQAAAKLAAFYQAEFV
ncbi:alpha/beta hydrolase [Mitsuokella sp.]|uniref:alpha/beta hydrolase n=1 Tax=Mitsuokella sp. TaxID=2049034 RepID=UPI003D7D552F